MHKTHTNITHTNASTRSLGRASAQRTLMLTVGGTQRHSIQHRIYKFFFFFIFCIQFIPFQSSFNRFFFLSFFSLLLSRFFHLSLSLPLVSYSIILFFLFLCSLLYHYLAGAVAHAHTRGSGASIY